MRRLPAVAVRFALYATALLHVTPFASGLGAERRDVMALDARPQSQNFSSTPVPFDDAARAIAGQVITGALSRKEEEEEEETVEHEQLLASYHAFKPEKMMSMSHSGEEKTSMFLLQKENKISYEEYLDMPPAFKFEALNDDEKWALYSDYVYRQDREEVSDLRSQSRYEYSYELKAPEKNNANAQSRGTLWYIFGILAIVAGLLCALLVLSSSLILRKTMPDSISAALFDLLPLFLFGFGFGLAMCCCSIYRGQGVYVRFYRLTGEDEQYRPHQDFRHDGKFPYWATMAAVSLVLIVLTLLLNYAAWKKKKKKGKASDSGAAVTGPVRGASSVEDGACVERSSFLTGDDDEKNLTVSNPNLLKSAAGSSSRRGSSSHSSSAKGGDMFVISESLGIAPVGEEEEEEQAGMRGGNEPIKQHTNQKQAQAHARLASQPEPERGTPNNSVAQSAQAAAAVNTPKKKPRYHNFDYLKYVLLHIIIVMHMCPPVVNKNEPVFRDMEFLVLLAVPGFAVLSGANSSFDAKGLNARRFSRPLKIALAYYIAQAFYIFFLKYPFKAMLNHTFDSANADFWYEEENPFHAKTFLDNLFGPSFWHLWYLQALVVWLVLIPTWMTLRFPLTLALVVSYIGMYFPESTYEEAFTPAQALIYFPYFVLGACIKKYDLEEYTVGNNLRDRMASMSCVLLALGCGMVNYYEMAHELGLFSDWGGVSIREQAMDDQKWYWIGRAGCQIMYVGIIWGSLRLFPNKPSYISKVAGYTLIPYIWHFSIYLVLVGLGWYGNKDFATGEANMASWKVFVTFLFAIANAQFWFIPFVAMVFGMVLMPPCLDRVLFNAEVNAKGKKENKKKTNNANILKKEESEKSIKINRNKKSVSLDSHENIHIHSGFKKYGVLKAA